MAIRKYKKKTYKKKGGSKAMKKVARRVVHQVLAKRVEPKHLDVTNTQIGTWSGAGFQLNLIPQGDTDITRDGSAAHAYGLSLKYTVTAAPTGADVQRLRVLILWWKQQSGNTFDPTEVMQTTGSAQAVLSAREWSRRSDFRVIYDKLHTVTTNLTTVDSGSAETRTHYFRLNQTMTYLLTTTNSDKNGLWIVFFADTAGDSPTIQWYTRLLYTDQ